nr:hypothetical protein [Tanacetum cinerariifolium]
MNNEIFDDNSISGEESDSVESFSINIQTSMSWWCQRKLGVLQMTSGEGSTSHTDVGVNEKDPSLH